MQILAKAKRNNLMYFVYILPAVCAVQLINAWRQAGLRRGCVDYSENGEQMTDTQTNRGSRTKNTGIVGHIFSGVSFSTYI